MKNKLRQLINLLSLTAFTTAYGAYQKPSEAALRAKLTPLQYEVTQQQGTEPPFKNAYWDNKEPGIYVDIVSGEPIFISTDKFESHTGWPSFTKPLNPDNIVLTADHSLSEPRTEVSVKNSGTHLGHVFDDGPPPTNKRYCINSASLEFIPVNDLKKRGYEKYLSYFSKTPANQK